MDTALSSNGTPPASFGKAFAPSHITGFFQIFPDGSTGAGLNTVDGAVSEVWTVSQSADLIASTSRVTVELNQVPSDAPVSRRVVAAFENWIPSDRRVIARQRILSPIGYGLGMSGAGAFSLALALNQAVGHPLSYDACMNVARAAEIASGTGLGDVVGQQFAGVMIGCKPYPSLTVKAIPCIPLSVVCAFFEPIETAAIIRNAEWKNRINEIGGECMERIELEPTLERFISLSREFTFRTGLLSEDLRAVLDAIPHATMAMLGQTAFVITDDVAKAVLEFSKFTSRIQVSSITTMGASEVTDWDVTNQTPPLMMS